MEHLEVRHRRSPPDRGGPGRYAVAGLVTVVLWAVTGSGGAVEFPAEDPIILAGDLHDRTQIVYGWRYQPGDNPAWADPELDDSGWAVISSLLPLDDEPPGSWERSCNHGIGS